MENNSLDDIFNEFIKNNKLGTSLDDFLKKIYDKNNTGPMSSLLLTNFEAFSRSFKDILRSQFEKDIDETMGPPDKIQYSNKGNLFFETKIWHTEQGDIVKQTITEDSSIKLAPPIRNLQKELADAIENEDYEKAAIIRDEINNKTKNK